MRLLRRGLRPLLAMTVVFLTASFAFAQLDLSKELVSFRGEQTISLDLKGMDIIEVLKTLAAKGDMNIVVGANVRGRVTMFLKDVDVKEAFEIILAANNLASDKRGDILYVMTERDFEQIYGRKYGEKKEVKIIQLKYAKAVEINKALSQIKTKIGKIIIDEGSNTVVIIDAPEALAQAAGLVETLDKPTSTMMFELSYAAVADIKEKIEPVLTKSVGSIQVDERTNKILITDLKDRMGEIEKIISAFDAKSQQVLIDAKIIEITLTDEYRLGIDWEAVITEFQDTLKNPISVQSSFAFADAGLFTTGAELLVGNFGSGGDALLIQALKTIGDANTLSNPRITVLNNEEAKILIGTSEPYAVTTTTQSGDVATTGTEVAFVDVGVKLHVTPTINRNKFITMKIKPEVSSTGTPYTYGENSTQVPRVSTTQAETSVMIKDGHTIIIAGLISDDRSDATNEVPFLGSIPLIGLMFKNSLKSVQKKELAIFLTPHIISGESDYLEVPQSPPVNENRFTMPEAPAFYKRKPVKMSPEYLYEGEDRPANPLEGLYKGDKKAKGDSPLRGQSPFAPQEPRPRLRPSSPEEYFLVVKKRILENLAIPKGDPRVSVGDKVKVYFRLYSGGNLAVTPKIIESTNETLSEEVIDAIQRSDPFVPFPLSIREFKKDFSLEIVYDP